MYQREVREGLGEIAAHRVARRLHLLGVEANGIGESHRRVHYLGGLFMAAAEGERLNSQKEQARKAFSCSRILL